MFRVGDGGGGGKLSKSMKKVFLKIQTRGGGEELLGFRVF